jgi:hypothetical protein
VLASALSSFYGPLRIVSSLSVWYSVLAVEQRMKLQSAVLDKSVVHRSAEQVPEHQIQIWNHLHTHFQIVIPSILIEEIIVNVADPGPLQWSVVQEMMRCLLRIQPCWMDDVFEIAYREMVQQQPLTTLPAFPVEFAKPILRLKPDDQELLKWARDRKSDRVITAQIRAAAQDNCCLGRSDGKCLMKTNSGNCSKTKS